MVLVGALATSRFQRIREGVLLRTLGATRAQIFRIVLVEYFALGAHGGGGGGVLSAAAGVGAGEVGVRGRFSPQPLSRSPHGPGVRRR